MATSSILSSLSSSLLGGGTGIDVTSTVNQLVAGLRAPEIAWQIQQGQLQGQINSLSQLNDQITSLYDSVNALYDPNSSIASRTVTSSAQDIVTASATNGAIPASHTVVVNNLATTGTYYTDAVASDTTALASGSFTIQVGSGTASTITIDSTNNTLAQLASSINAQNIGVTASVVSDSSGARLALVSNTSGSSGDLTVANVDSGLNFNKGVTGINASLTVDGVPISSATNVVSNAVSGLTLTLAGASPNTPVQLSVAPDSSSVTQAVTDFVNAYNTIIQNLNSQFAFDSTSQSAGTLSGDGDAREVQSQLLSAMSFSLGSPNAYSTLASLGISMNDDGTLTVDQSALGTAISTNYTAVQTFFQGTNNDGFASMLHTQLSNLTDSTQGAVYLDIQGKNDTISSLQDQIDNFEVYIASQQALLTAQYSQVDVILRQLPLLQQQLNAELGLTSSSSTSNG